MKTSSAGTVDRLALLSTGRATTYVTDRVRAGYERPPLATILQASLPLEDRSARWDAAPVREILDEAVRRFGALPTSADPWLAPRLHATLRMTRAEAARPEIWNFLALAVAPEYVLWRHRGIAEAAGGEPKIDSARFIGRHHHHQAFARLWWAAEMFRDGADYRPVQIVCADQDMLDTALPLDVIDHKPTALAMTRLVERLTESGTSRLGERVRALCKAVNVAGSTLMYDVIAPADLPFQDALLQWIDDAESAPAVPWDRLPDGPDDGAARPASIEVLTRTFERFIVDARGDD